MILVSHESALLYWRIASLFSDAVPVHSRKGMSEGDIPMDVEIQRFWAYCRIGFRGGEGWAFTDGHGKKADTALSEADRIKGLTPAVGATIEGMLEAYGNKSLHVLVSQESAKTPRSGLTLHSITSGHLSRWLVKIDSKLSVVLPEMCFIQMAASLSIYHLIELGFELCGGYSIGDNEYRVPVTTTSRLAAFIDGSRGMRGIQEARRALRYIRNGSASHMETKMAMVLGLPCSLGGFGLGMPEMNREVNVGVRNRTANPLAKSSYRCDLYWEKGSVSVEYDSDLWHTGPSRIAADAKRRSDLALLGIRVVTVTNMQTKSRLALRAIAQLVARYCGHRIRPRVSDFWKRQTKLLKALQL